MLNRGRERFVRISGKAFQKVLKQNYSLLPDQDEDFSQTPHLGRDRRGVFTSSIDILIAIAFAALLWADILVAYALFVMQNYLTDVWKISLIRAALILNMWNGLYRILPLLFLYLVDAFLGNFKLLVVTSVAYSVGIGMVAMSTPPLANATGTCKRYEPECVGNVQKGLLYAGLVSIAVGVAGNIVSVQPFILEQREKDSTHNSSSGVRANGGRVDGSGRRGGGPKGEPHQVLGLIGVVVVGIAGAIALPYIRPRTLKFGIPAIFTALGTILFLTGSCSYKKDPPKGSPLCNVCRVFVAASLKCFRSYPIDNNCYHGIREKRFTSTRCLRILEKAAIKLPGEDPETTNKWRLCSVAEVEEAKIAVRMVPMWMTFVVSGIVLSAGDTYFVEQAGKLNRNIGKLRLPIQVLLLARKSTKDMIAPYIKDYLLKTERDTAPSFGIAGSMICSILCCITAALVERKRLKVVIRQGLLDNSDAQIDMSIYWLLFQFALLGGLESLLENSVVAYYVKQSPESMRSYLLNFTRGVTGLGFMGSALSVYVVGKISERGGKTNWFQHILNRSRLDRYYWVLAAMNSVNLVVFVVVAKFYRYKKPEERSSRELFDPAGAYTDGFTEGDQNRSCLCFC